MAIQKIRQQEEATGVSWEAMGKTEAASLSFSRFENSQMIKANLEMREVGG